MTSTQRLPILRREGGRFVPAADDFAHEVHITLASEAGHDVRLLATPQDIEPLAIGHALSEGWWDGQGQLLSVNVQKTADGYTAMVQGADTWGPIRESRLIHPSCGGCGDDMASPPAGHRLTAEHHLDPEVLTAFLRGMRSNQPMFEATGGVHAAALVSDDDQWVLSEDIGRHSAVDKAIGSWLLHEPTARPAALVLSGRCGWDLMAKAVRVGIRQVACVGAISGAAVQLAREYGVLLMGFASGADPQFVGPWPTDAAKS